MRRFGWVVALWAVAGAAGAQVVSCASAAVTPAPAGLPAGGRHAAPVVPELPAHPRRLGVSGGVLAEGMDEALSVEAVLLRLRMESCRNVAHALPPAKPGAPLTRSPAAYTPPTQFDNSPWRFDMSQGGKRMTADEFDAWMKARGVRVAKGAPQPVAPPPDAEPTADEKK